MLRDDGAVDASIFFNPGVVRYIPYAGISTIFKSFIAVYPLPGGQGGVFIKIPIDRGKRLRAAFGNISVDGYILRNVSFISYTLEQEFKFSKKIISH